MGKRNVIYEWATSFSCPTRPLPHCLLCSLKRQWGDLSLAIILAIEICFPLFSALANIIFQTCFHRAFEPLGWTSSARRPPKRLVGIRLRPPFHHWNVNGRQRPRRFRQCYPHLRTIFLSKKSLLDRWKRRSIWMRIFSTTNACRFQASVVSIYGEECVLYFSLIFWLFHIVGHQYRLAHTDVTIPDFSSYRRSSTRDTAKKSSESSDDRRAFTYIITAGSGVAGAVAAKNVVQGCLNMLSPARDCLALSKIEVNIGSIPEGKNVTVKWRGKPRMFCVR